MAKARKFTDEQLRQMVAAYAAGEKVDNIRDRFGVGGGTLQRAINASGVKLRSYDNKRLRMVEFFKANPNAKSREAVALFRTSIHYVWRIRRETGLRKRDHVALLGAPTPHQSGLKSLSQ